MLLKIVQGCVLINTELFRLNKDQSGHRIQIEMLRPELKAEKKIPKSFSPLQHIRLEFGSTNVF